MKSPIITTLVAVLALFTLALGKDKLPRGYEPTSSFEEVRAEALEKGKFITLLMKGKDGCPNCERAISNGERAVKTSSVLLFSRVEKVRAPENGLPAEITKNLGQLTYGFSVQFVVIDPTDLSIVATASRKELQDDRKATKAFKDTVREARKALQEAL